MLAACRSIAEIPLLIPDSFGGEFREGLWPAAFSVKSEKLKTKSWLLVIGS